MKKLIASLAVCSMIACAAFSCGDKDDSTPFSEAETTSAVSEESSTDAEESSSESGGSSKDESSSGEESKKEDQTKASSETTTDKNTKDAKTTETSSAKGGETSSSSSESSKPASETSAPDKREYRTDVDTSAFIGNWECEKLEVDGEEVTDYDGLPVSVMFQIVIEKDGTAYIAAQIYSETSEEPPKFTWGAVDENSIELVDEYDNIMLLTLKDGKLIGTEEGFSEKLTLKKVDKFTEFDYNSLFE